MKCTQIQELLPLYAGHDLDERHEQLVTAHLQTCATCSLAADGYREARELMHDFAPPVFGDEIYAEIRKNVWKRIENESPARSLFESMAVWFQPRFAWTAAAAVMITISLVTLYFVVKEFDVRPVNVVSVPRIVTPAMGPPPETRDGGPLIPGEGPRKQRQADRTKRQRKPDRIMAPDSGNSLVAYLPDAQVPTMQNQSFSAPTAGTENLDSAAYDQKTLRMEIQTKDPNIRIIWFLSESPNQ